MVAAKNAYFIRLGAGNCWARDCIDNGYLRLDFREVPHQTCLDADWERVLDIKLGDTKSRGAAVSQTNQIRHFYEADENTLWITFHADQLQWCFSKPGSSLYRDQATRIRETVDGWHGSDITGNLLLKNTLSGHLLATEGFRGTICSVTAFNYLLHKINGTVEPHVAATQQAYENLRTTLKPIIKGLHPKDFETLIDLIFRHSGWQRVGVSGGTEKDIDLDLLLPVTGERIAIQIKSQANEETWRDYQSRFAEMRSFKRFYFVTHSPSLELRNAVTKTNAPNMVFWDEHEIAEHVARAGLTGWLLDKAA